MILCNLPLQAQPIIEAPPPPLLPSETEIPLPSEPAGDILTIPSPDPGLQQDSSSELEDTIISEDTIVVKSFKFEGNTAFSNRQLSDVVASFVDRPLTFTELLEARSAITDYYVSQGYITSGAYIAPQEIADDNVTITIVEGSLESIEVEVDGRLSPDYVSDRIALATGKPLNATKLLTALQVLQINPLIAEISANLAASPYPGKSILNVSVVSAPSFGAQAILDNGRSPQVGSVRRGIQLEDINLTGWGDTLRGIYLNSDGSDDIDIAYNRPFNPHNGTLGIRFRSVTSDIIEEPLDQADINSDYEKYEIQLRQPVIQTPQEELTLGISFDVQKSQSFLGLIPDAPFLVTSGTDNRGLTRVSTIRLFQEWLQRSDRQVLAARSELDWGIDAFGITESFDVDVNPNALNNRFFLWRGQFQWVYRFATDTLLVALADIQLADRPVVSLERFALGGLGSVRGYRQNTLLTDNGVFASVEVRLPILRLPEQDSVLQLIPFADIGTGWNADGFNPTPSTLASVGLGLQWRYSDFLNARLDWGITLGRVPFEGDTLQDDGILFRVVITP